MLVGAAIALSGSSLVAADPKRDAPDYDGRGNTDNDTGSWPPTTSSPRHNPSGLRPES